MTQGRKGNSSDYFQSPLSWGAGTHFFCPPNHFCGAFWLRAQQFCAHIILFLSRNNSIPWIHFSFSFPAVAFFLPGLGNGAFSSSNQRGKSYTRWRLTGFYSFPFFSCEGNEMKNRSAMVYQPSILTQWPATYPKQLQCPPFKWPLLFYFVHVRYKLWWMLYRSYSVIWP